MTPFPAGGVLNDVVGVQVEDIDFAEEVVIEDEIAAEGSRGGIAQVLADEAGFEFSPFGTSKIGVDAMKAGDHAKKKKQQRQQKPDFLKMFEERTDAYDRLKEALKEAFGGDSPKAFIFVDELDRCRPDYAISYLETIKHVFDIQ